MHIANAHAFFDGRDFVFRSTYIPFYLYVHARLLSNNELDKIKADGLFEKLPELQHLDLRKNKISRIEASAFQGAHNLTDL